MNLSNKVYRRFGKIDLKKLHQRFFKKIFNMKKGLVSIIIPYYKKNFLKKTFISAVNQSYKNIEIIIIYDDNSKSELKFIKKIVQNKKNTKVLVNSKILEQGFQEIEVLKKAKENI